MKFFFDRCMSIKLARMVAILEGGQHLVSHHDEDRRFTRDTPDTEWINALSQDTVRPVIITGDDHILKRPDEVAALRASGLTFFCLTDHWSQLAIRDMAWRFLKVWPEIVQNSKVSEPTVFEVRAGKSLTLIRRSGEVN